MSTVELPTRLNLAELNDLYDRGLYLQLYQQAQAAGLLEQWPGVRGGVLAARAASHLGAPRLSNAILRRLQREASEDPEVRYFAAYLRLRRSGPYKSWREFLAQPDLGPTATPDIQASWHALIGETAAVFRDFDTARTWLRKAEAFAAESAWIQVCWSHVYELEDRYEDALAAAQRSMEIRPMYRAGVQSAGHLLSLMNRDDEALKLFSDALEVVECGPIAAQLCALQMELRDYAGARRSLEEVIRLTPLAEKEYKKWIAAQRSELAYQDGDLAAAISFAKSADTPFFKDVVANLEAAQAANAAPSAVLLDVPFVRQHHVTCAPATLSAISRFWNKPAEHVLVADEICYNGTTSHAERQWAEHNGWAVQEFTVTAESARQLLDRGIPFTLVTTDPGNAHLQAVIGYDQRRGTLHIRDPYFRSAAETTAQKFFERYRTFGPRGMAMVPAESANLLEGLELPDTELWNLLYAIDDALVKHRRPAAQTAYEKLLALAPNHRLAHDARRRLAIYDFNPTDQLAAIEAWLLEFPGDDRLQWEQLGLMRYQTSREQRLGQLAQLCEKLETHPIFWRQYAGELQQDARRHREVETLLAKALRRWPSDAANYYTLANIRWDQRRWEESLELYRLAACLADKDEQYFGVYFSAAVWLRQTEPLLALLRERYERLGKKSMQPARTLATALSQLNRDAEGLALLEEAMLLRPADGPLMLCAADMYVTASHAHMPRAQELLEAARNLAPRTEWLRTAARLSSAAGDSAAALHNWREVAQLQPLSTDAHQAVVRLLAETAGQSAALEYLAHTCGQRPHYYALHAVWAEWVRDEPREVREPVLRQMLELAPDDAWLRRELAITLSNARQFAEAWEHTDLAGKLEPFNPAFPHLQSILHKNENRAAEAKQALREAIKLSVDADYAIAALMELCTTLPERRAALELVRDELVRQVTAGDGLLAFRVHASGVWDDAEVLDELQKALAARPDLWHAWSAVTQQLVQLERLDEALTNSQRATERFPLLPRLWYDLARVHRARLEFDAEYHALENALRVNPGWAYALRAMSECLGRKREFQQVRQFAERAVAHTPLDPLNHLQLAETLWQLDEPELACERIKHVIHVEPGLENAWDQLLYWSREIGQPEIAVEAARELTQRRGGEVRSWLLLNRMLDQPEQIEESLAALDKALELNPRSIDVYDSRAFTLAKVGRYREALAACEPAVFAGEVPAELKARAAWIEAERGDLPAAIVRLRQVLNDEPQNYTYWKFLADWCERNNDNPGNLEAAEQMARLRPQSEASLGYLGEARLKSGDRAGAKQAFARAFELAPTYEFAGSHLFDLLLEDRDLSAAAEIIETLREHSSTAFVITRDLQLAVRQQDLGRALEMLRQVCVTPSEGRWPLNTAVSELVEQGQAVAVEKVLQQALEQDSVLSEVARHWMDLVIKRVQKGSLPDPAKLYHVEPKIPRTRNYAAAWMRLGDLYHEHHDHESTLRVAQALCECSPDVAMTYGYLGEAHLDNGDKVRAINAYERALELDPDYGFASDSLFTLYLEARTAVKIQSLIEKLESERYSSLLTLRKVQLAALNKDAASAAENLEVLCSHPLDPQWTLRYAIIALEEEQMHSVAAEVLARVCRNPEVQDEVALQHAKYKAKHDAFALQNEISDLLDKPGSAEKSLQAWFTERIDSDHNLDVRRFIAKHKTKLLADVKLWGQVVWAASRMRDYKLVREFGQRWRDYPAAEAWMLVNVVEGFRFYGEDRTAIEVSQHALTLPNSNGKPFHYLWLACDAACAGKFDEALDLMNRIGMDPQRFDADYKFLHLLLESILQLVYCDPSQKNSIFARVRTKLRESYWNYQKQGLLDLEPARARLFAAARRRIRIIMGTLRAQIWFYFSKA